MFDAALLGVAAAGFGFAGEHGAGLEERVPICFFLQIMWRMKKNTSTAEQQMPIFGPKNSLYGRE